MKCHPAGIHLLYILCLTIRQWLDWAKFGFQGVYINQILKFIDPRIGFFSPK